MAEYQNFYQVTPDGKVAYGIVGTTVFRTPVDTASAPTAAGDAPAEANRLASLPRATRMELDGVKRIEFHEDDLRQIRLVPSEKGASDISVDVRDAAAQQQFADAFRAAAGGKYWTESRGTNLLPAVGVPAFFAALVALLGFIVYSDAAEIAAGTNQESERVGRARTRAKAFEAVARALGTTGTLVAGGILLALCVAWLIYELKHVHPVVTLKR